MALTSLFLSRAEALKIANTALEKFEDTKLAGVYGEDVLQGFIDEVQRVLDVTNIEAYLYPYSILMKIRREATELLKVQGVDELREDLHFMGRKDVLVKIALDYYGSSDQVLEIMRSNRIYNTDEAIAKGVLKVVNNRG